MAVLFSLLIWTVASTILIIFIQAVLQKHIPFWTKLMIVGMVLFFGMRLSSQSAYTFENNAIRDLQSHPYLILERGIEPFTEINPASLYAVPLSRMSILVYQDRSLMLKILDNHKGSKNIIVTVEKIDCVKDTVLTKSIENAQMSEVKIALDNEVCSDKWKQDAAYRAKVQNNIDKRFYKEVIAKSLIHGGIAVVVTGLIVWILYFKNRSRVYRTLQQSIHIKFFSKLEDDYTPSELVAVAWLMVRNIDEELPAFYKEHYSRIELIKKLLIRLFGKLVKDPDEFVFLKPRDLLEYFYANGLDEKVRKIPGLERYLFILIFPIAQKLNDRSSIYYELTNAFFECEVRYMKHLSFKQLFEYNTQLTSPETTIHRFDFK